MIKAERQLERGVNFFWLFRRIVGQEGIVVTKKWHVVVWYFDNVLMTWILVLFFWRKFLFDRWMYHLNTIINTRHTRIICFNSMVIIQHSEFFFVIVPPSSCCQSVLASMYLNKKHYFIYRIVTLFLNNDIPYFSQFEILNISLVLLSHKMF